MSWLRGRFLSESEAIGLTAPGDAERRHGAYAHGDPVELLMVDFEGQPEGFEHFHVTGFVVGGDAGGYDIAVRIPPSAEQNSGATLYAVLRGIPEGRLNAYSGTDASEASEGVSFDSLTDWQLAAVMTLDSASARSTLMECVKRLLGGGKAARGDIDIGNTPAALTRVGCKAGRLVISEGVVDKSLFDHQVPQSVFASLPALIADPAMIFESDTQAGTFVVVTTEAIGARPVMVFVRPSTDAGRVEVSRVVSMYGKDKPEIILRWMKDGLLYFADKQKSLAVSTLARLRLPGRVQLRRGGEMIFAPPPARNSTDSTTCAPWAQINEAAHDSAFGDRSPKPPTPAQCEAGNYKVGRAKVLGFHVAIENPAGSIRRGCDPNGVAWETRMPAHYGYLSGTTGADGDGIDCFIGPWPELPDIYVVNQWLNGRFDEHKVMFGFIDEAHARSTYLASYSPGWQGLRDIVRATPKQLRAWLRTGNPKKPLTSGDLSPESDSMDKVTWDGVQPVGKGLAEVLYGIRAHDADEGLLFDSLTDADLESELDSMDDSGAYGGQAKEGIAATAALLRYFNDFIKSSFERAKVPPGLEGFAARSVGSSGTMTKTEATKILHDLVDIAINRKGGIELTPEQEREYNDYRHDARIIDDYMNRRIRHTGSRNLLRMPELKAKYPHIDNQPRDEFDSATWGGDTLDAIAIESRRIEATAKALQRALNGQAGAVKPVDFTVSKPRMLQGILNVTVLFRLSDGQTLTIFFNNPDATPRRLKPEDVLVSWKWLLNRKDVTIVVAPERGRDLNLNTVALRVMALADKNSAAFTTAQAGAAAKEAVITDLKEQIKAKTEEFEGLERQIAAIKSGGAVPAVKDDPAPEVAAKDRAAVIAEVESALKWGALGVTRPIAGGDFTFERDGGSRMTVTPELRAEVEAKIGRPLAEEDFPVDGVTALILNDEIAPVVASRDLPFLQKDGSVSNAAGTENLPKDWTGIAVDYSDTNKFWLIGWENGERSFTPLKAKTYEAAKSEAAAVQRPAPAPVPIPEGFFEFGDITAPARTLLAISAGLSDQRGTAYATAVEIEKQAALRGFRVAWSTAQNAPTMDGASLDDSSASLFPDALFSELGSDGYLVGSVTKGENVVMTVTVRGDGMAYFEATPWLEANSYEASELLESEDLNVWTRTPMAAFILVEEHAESPEEYEARDAAERAAADAEREAKLKAQQEARAAKLAEMLAVAREFGEGKPGFVRAMAGADGVNDALIGSPAGSFVFVVEHGMPEMHFSMFSNQKAKKKGARYVLDQTGRWLPVQVARSANVGRTYDHGIAAIKEQGGVVLSDAPPAPHGDEKGADYPLSATYANSGGSMRLTVRLKDKTARFHIADTDQYIGDYLFSTIQEMAAGRGLMLPMEIEADEQTIAKVKQQIADFGAQTPAKRSAADRISAEAATHGVSVEVHDASDTGYLATISKGAIKGTIEAKRGGDSFHVLVHEANPESAGNRDPEPLVKWFSDAADARNAAPSPEPKNEPTPPERTPVEPTNPARDAAMKFLMDAKAGALDFADPAMTEKLEAAFTPFAEDAEIAELFNDAVNAFVDFETARAATIA